MNNKMTIRIIALLVFGLVLAFVGCGSGNEGKIIFTSRSESQTNTSYLYSMNPDGSNLERLTYWYHPMPYHNIWSADGKILACVEYFEDTEESWLSVVDSNTGTHRKLLDITDRYVESIALSPDRKTIVLSVDSTRVTRIKTPEGNTVHVEIIKEYDMDLFAVDVKTGEMKRLTDTRDVMEKWPSYSPDGRQIVFVGRIDTETTKNVPRDVFIVDSDGSNRRLIAHHSKGWGIYLIEFQWSPDNRFIAYSYENVPVSDIDNYSDVFVIDVSNGKLLNLTNTSNINESNPRWSPDSTRLAYLTTVPESRFHDGTVIYNFQNRSTANYGWVSSSWTPDGKGFIFTNSRNVFELMVVDIESGNQHPLAATNDIRISNPVWISK